MNAATALVLVGHGSSRHAEAPQAVLDLAAAVRRRGRFAEVAACFLKNPPGPETVLSGLAARRVVVVPVFSGRGHYTERIIPQAFGLAGSAGESGGRNIVITPPAGAHPRLPGLLAARAEAVLDAEGLSPAAASLLLLAHGSSRAGASGETPRAVAAALAATGRFREVAVAFLEQEPRAGRWPDLVAGPEVVALPLLVAQGMHAGQDIPPLFGLGEGEAGPVVVAGRRVRLAARLGAEPELVDIVLDLADAAPG